MRWPIIVVLIILALLMVSMIAASIHRKDNNGGIIHLGKITGEPNKSISNAKYIEGRGVRVEYMEGGAGGAMHGPDGPIVGIVYKDI